MAETATRNISLGALSGGITLIIFVILGLIQLAFSIYAFALYGDLNSTYTFDFNAFNNVCYSLTTLRILLAAAVLLIIMFVFTFVACVGQIIKIIFSVTKNEHEVISYLLSAIMVVVHAVLGLIVFCMCIAMSAYT